MHFTAHARRRMDQRGLTKPMIYAVVIHGKQSPGFVGRTVHSFNGINAVTAQKDGDTVVITVYEDRERKWRHRPSWLLPTGTKKQRRKVKRCGA